MASNVANSCKVWNCAVRCDGEGKEIIGKHGNVEHLRGILPDDCEVMKANYMYWLTDRTPHELLPLQTACYRQYFRLVTSDVTVWFEEHSTPNPLGVMPDCKRTIILKGSKVQ